MRLGERSCYYYVVYSDGTYTDLMPRHTAYEYASMFSGGVHIHDSAPWWRKLMWHGPIPVGGTE